MMNKEALTHFDKNGNPSMIDINSKEMTKRVAIAIGKIKMQPKTLKEILDDMVILRSDNTPTYMLSSVVDDYEMGVTHIIRGDDHLNNAFRQIQIIKYMSWKEPFYQEEEFY